MIDQIGIGVFGALAVFLSQQKSLQLSRWACISGLCAQPFWLHMTYTAGQWGVFLLCVLYAGCWLSGLNNFWVEPFRARRAASPLAKH